MVTPTLILTTTYHPGWLVTRFVSRLSPFKNRGRQLPYLVWALVTLGPVVALVIWQPIAVSAAAFLAVLLLATAVIYSDRSPQ
ncbi:MAG: hypothetical protein M5U34_31275 [Chloroflexi bacterium]|nr:hypothetical protein [Chloroflexota bacterium]